MTSRKKTHEKKGTVPVCRVAGLRIIGGKFRGSKLAYSGELRTRPMKDRVREALFNLLGRAVNGKIAIDLFAGTGALALEALSRGAKQAVAIEMHRPTARLIWENASGLGIEVRREYSAEDGERTDSRAEPDQYIEIVTADAFIWASKVGSLGKLPWLVFCSPPYDFYVDRKDGMLRLLNHLIGTSPVESLFAVEADERFDFNLMPHRGEWDVRPYPPTVLGIWEKR
jgi:16S rRNA (guanine966-N2)-methyltransferase